jgi:ATP-dependent exoDNAse (exonuclease V) beta subunit
VLIKLFKPKGPQMTTDFSKIKFNADTHRYFYDDKELSSVTWYIKQFQKPFDRDRIAERTAKKENIPLAQVLAEWDLKAENGRRLGTLVHEHIEKVLRGEDSGQLSLDPFLSLNTKAPEIVAFDQLWSELAPTISYNKDHIEWIIGDRSLGLAGTVDSMLFSPETGRYHIWDWKTGKFDLHNKWENLLPPFTAFDASKLHIYSLQVSLYRLIIEQNTDLELGDSYLVHLSEAGAHRHRAIDFREILMAYIEGGEI